ncbi:MAG TPA: inositol monophosphatase family protein, partial [bacterium]|nr:inositol monophosphatase family protein [bacterium]
MNEEKPMYDPREIVEILQRAGDIAQESYLQVSASWKENRTYVTEADLKVQEYLKGEFDRRFPDDGIIAEENDLRKPPKSGDRFWIIDPIDGTASFVAGLPVWGTAIGLIEHNKPLAGFFYLPAAGDLFYTQPEGRVMRNGKAVRLKDPGEFHPETALLALSRLHRHFTIDAQFPGKLRSLGSSVAHLCYLAAGCADGAFLWNVHLWDIAAGLAMLANNGGVIRGLGGRRFALAGLLDGEQQA